MTRIRTVAAVSLALLLLATGVTLVAANDTARGEPDVEAFAPETAFVPGEAATLSVTLNNRGDLSDEGFDDLETEVLTAHEATLSVRTDDLDEVDGVDEVPFDVRTDEQAIGDVRQGPAGPFEFTVVPDADAEPGTYTVPLELNYRDVTRAERNDGGATVREESAATQIVFVDVEITDRAQFAVVDVDSTVQAGNSGTVDVTLRNVGAEAASEATVSASPLDPALAFATGADVAESYADEWAPGEERTFSYRVDATPDAVPRPTPLEVTVDYRDADGADATARTVRAGITPAPEQSFDATGLNSTLRVGEDGTFEATVVNEGPRDLEGVVVVFDGGATVAEGPAGQGGQTDSNVVPRETRATVGDLAAGESATVRFEAGVREDAAAGPRTLDVETRYRSLDGDVATSDSLDVVVDVAPEEDVFTVEAADPATAPANATPGDTVRYNVVVRNTGSEPVRNVQAKLFANDPLDATDDEAFVAELDPGESTTVSFEVEIGDGASPKAYATSVDFRYDDADGEASLSDTYRLPVDVVEGEDSGALGFLSPPLLIGGLGAVAVVGVVVWKRGRIARLLGRSR